MFFFFFSSITLNNGQDLTITVTDFFFCVVLVFNRKEGIVKESSLTQKCL